MTSTSNSSDVRPAKRYVDRSALLISAIGFAVLAGGGYQWYRIALGRNAKALFAFAQQCADKKDYTTAAAQWTNYVQLCPGDTAARVRLAETYDLAFSNLGQTQRTIELYREALGQAPEEKKVLIHARLAELLLRSRQFVAATDEADAVLKADSNDAGAASLKAKAIYGQAQQGKYKGQPGDIGTYFEKALSRDPGNQEIAMTLAHIYREEPQYLSEKDHDRPLADRASAADQVVDKLVAANSANSEVYLARYQYRQDYHLPGADDDLKEAVRLGPENIDVLLASGKSLRRKAGEGTSTSTSADQVRKLREAARANYEKVVSLAKTDYRGHFGLGETLWELGQSQAAITAWKRGAESASTGADSFNMVLAAALLGMNQLNEAEAFLDRLAKAIDSYGPNKAVSERLVFTKKYELLRARWFRGKNEPFKAIALATAIANGAQVTPQELGLAVEAWSFLGEVYTSIGRWPEVADAYEKAATLSPNIMQYRILAASAWNEAHRGERAVRDLRLALAANDSSDLRLELAAAVFRQTLATPAARRDWPAVQSAVADAHAADSKQPLAEPWRLAFLEANFALARADSEGRHADGVRDAVAIYRTNHLDETSPTNLLPDIALAYEQIERHEEADRCIAKWEKTASPSQARMLRARVLAGRKQYAEARRLVDAALSDLKLAERGEALRFLFQLSVIQLDFDKAHADLNAIKDLAPRDMDLLFTYAELAAKQNQWTEVDRCRAKFVDLEGAQSRYAVYLQANKLFADAKPSDKSSLRDARTLVDSLVSQNPDWSPALLLRARLFDQIARMEKLDGDDLATLSLRVRSLHNEHRDGEIVPLVEAAANRQEKKSPANYEYYLAIGAIYESNEQYAAAERWDRRAWEAHAESFQPLAVVLAKQKRGSEAVGICLDAAKRFPPTHPAMVACVLRATGLIDENEFTAAASLIAAATNNSPEPQFLVMLGAVRIAQDRLPEAIAIYRQALAADPRDVRGLNNLATLLVEQPQHAKESLELIDRALALAGPQNWLLETKGQVLLRDGRIDEALQLLKKAAASAEPDPRMLLHLADAYRLAGNLDQARKALEEAQRRKVTQQLLTPTDRQLVKELHEKLGG